MTDIVMPQTITQTMRILFVPCGGSLEIFEQILGEFICGNDGSAFLAQGFEFVLNMFQGLGLTANCLRRDYSAAPANHSEAFECGTLQDFQRCDPLDQISMRQEGRLT